MLNKIRQIFPFLSWINSYSRFDLIGDFSAGLTVGIMLIPQGMAYAMIAGLPPVYGLYASIVPQLVYALMGTSRQLSVAPVAMDSLMVAVGVSVLATEGSEAYLGFAILLAFFSGLFQLLFGIFRLGFITNLLSKPVIIGFTTAAVIVIALNQLKYVLGIEIDKSNKIYEILSSIFKNLNSINWITIIISIGAILIIVGVKKIHKFFPGVLLAIIISILLVSHFGLDQLGVQIIGNIPKGLPSFTIPDFTLDYLKLLPLSFTISLLAFVEAFSISKAFEAKNRTHKIIPNQELLALGASNLLGSFFQAFPVTGSFSRSAINNQAGAKTPMSSIVSAGLIMLTLLFLTPLFYFLPKAVLGAVILVALTNLIDIKSISNLWKTDRKDFLMLLVTFMGTLEFGIVNGILIGIALSLGFVLYRVTYPQSAVLGKIPGTNIYRNIRRFKEAERIPQIFIYRFDAELFFANANYFKSCIENELTSNNDLKLIIINAEAISSIDSSATSMLEELIQELYHQKIQFCFAGVKGPVRDIMAKTRLVNKIGTDNFFDNIQQAVDTFEQKKSSSPNQLKFQTNYLSKH